MNTSKGFRIARVMKDVNQGEAAKGLGYTANYLSLIEEKPKKKKLKQELEEEINRLHDLQRVFYAQDRHSLLLVFQAMDAAGKDSTIRSVMSGINPAGCQVFSFKKPTPEELEILSW